MMRRMRFRIFCVFTVCGLMLAGGCGRKAADDKLVAATNTYLECAAADLLGTREKIMQLTGPGMCPGHFDIRPKQVEELRRCRMLLRFDFQKGLDAKLSAAAESGLKIVEVRLSGGLGEPESYLAACRQVGRALAEAGLIENEGLTSRLRAIEEREKEISSRAKAEIERAKLAGTAVIASGHQAAFCRFLGLKVAAEFSGPDTSRISEIDEAVRAGQAAGVKLIVGNEPEGRSVADALAERLGARVVMLANFPAGGDGTAFDAMVCENVNRLTQGVAR